MIDIKWIIDNPEKFHALLKKRHYTQINLEKLINLYKQIKNYTFEIQNLNKQRKILSDQFLKKEKINKKNNCGKEESKEINEKIDKFTTDQAVLQKQLNNLLYSIPNTLSEEVHEGEHNEDNKVVKNFMHDLKKNESKFHLDLAININGIETKQTSSMCGSRYITLKNELAKLSRALMNFMLDNNSQAGFQEVTVPFIVKEEAMFNAGQLPKFADQSFSTNKNDRLIPTSEVPLVNLVANTMLLEEELPIRYTAGTACFRSEAGNSGKDIRGMIRLHQFHKVELVSICHPKESTNEHEYILSTAENILKKLELPYRVVLLCAQDTGFTAHKTYDIEVWMPGQKKYREISSCSNCSDFQARRLKTKYKNINKEKFFVHTLNGSSLAIERTIAALLENYYSNGAIYIPKALQEYLKIDKIEIK